MTINVRTWRSAARSAWLLSAWPWPGAEVRALALAGAPGPGAAAGNLLWSALHRHRHHRL